MKKSRMQTLPLRIMTVNLTLANRAVFAYNIFSIFANGEIDLENNASSAGVKHGGLFNTAEIKILICYILSTVNEPVPVNMLANVLHYEGIANAFEVSDAIVSLAKSGHIKQFNAEEDTYLITESGTDVAQTLKTSLSITVKERACNAAIKMLSRFKNAKSTEFNIIKENGLTYIDCKLLDGTNSFADIRLQVADDMQANSIKEKFLNNPSEIYSGLIGLLTN